MLPFGVTTPPNSYSATIAVSNPGAGDTFAVVTGSLPPGLTMPAKSGSGTVITGNPAQTGTFNFTVKASLNGRTATLAYQITITVQGPPDQFVCRSRLLRRLPDQRDLRAARRYRRPAGPWTRGTCPPATRPAARSA